MKWNLIILILLCVACNGKITITEDEIGSGLFYAQDTYNPYSGKCVVVFNNTSVVKEQFNYKNGLLHGEALAWHKNGQMRRRGTYFKGQLEGKWEFWDEKGRKIVELQYKNDYLDGYYKAFYDNGKVKEKGKYQANKRTGKWTSYARDGQTEAPAPGD